MRILLKLVLDIDPDSAWRALQSPAVFREVSSPLLGMHSLDGGFPTRWTNGGSHAVSIDALDIAPIGAQEIAIGHRRVPSRPEVRMIRDSGRGLSGAMSILTEWEHTMTVAPTEDGRTLYRDRLVFSAGVATPAVWASLWAFWQLRGLRMQQLAPSWRHDVAADAAGPGA